MPPANLTGSAMIRPSAPRSTCQQSSMTRCLYPASRMPVSTMASAVWRIRALSTSQPNLFQVLKPMGGTGARSSAGAAAAFSVGPPLQAASKAMARTAANAPLGMDAVLIALSLDGLTRTIKPPRTVCQSEEDRVKPTFFEKK